MEQKTIIVVAGSSVALPWFLALIVFVVILVLRVKKNRQHDRMVNKAYGLSSGSDTQV
jgi:hypothetical protein